jgi:hypothetical protein
MPHTLGSAYWRERAKEARELAEKMSDPESRGTLLEIALDYEKLAKRAEAELKPVLEKDRCARLRLFRIASLEHLMITLTQVISKGPSGINYTILFCCRTGVCSSIHRGSRRVAC